MITLSEWRGLLDDLRDAIGCPIDWSRNGGDGLLHKELRLYWVEVAKQVQVCSEMYAYDQLHVAERFDQEELRTIQINSAIWRPRAERMYRDKCGFIEQIRYVTPRTQMKHYARPRFTEDDSRTASERGNSLFYPGVDERILNNYVFDSLRFGWRDIVDNRPAHLYLIAESDIGASNGKSTPYLRLDFDYSTAEVHGHPIGQSEKPATECWLNEAPKYPYYEDEDLMRPDIDEKWIMPHRDDVAPLTPAFDKMPPRRPTQGWGDPPNLCKH